MIYKPELSARILAAMQSVMLSNNGYSDIGNNSEVADALTLAGFTVIRTVNIHGNPVYRAFTQAAQAALKVESFGVSTYKPITSRDDGIDYEAAILDRQAASLFE